jgi:hypothetical protein
MADIVATQIIKKNLETPEELLDAAKSSRNPMNKFFEWDNDKAAHAHRLQRAREYFNSIEFEFVNDGPPKKTFYSVMDYETDQRVYRTFEAVIENEGNLSYLSKDSYKRIAAEVRKIRDLGLDKKDRAWKALCDCVEKNVPKAIREERDAA